MGVHTASLICWFCGGGELEDMANDDDGDDNDEVAATAEEWMALFA